ncbi:hypothetical protein ACVIGB_001062 [Bradyrhizobium sp. USDA 4341]
MTELSSHDFAALLLGEELASATSTESVIVLKGHSTSASLRLISPAERISAVVWDYGSGSQILLCGQADYVKAEFNGLASSLAARAPLTFLIRRGHKLVREMRGQIRSTLRLSSGLTGRLARTIMRGLLPAVYQSRIRSR